MKLRLVITALGHQNVIFVLLSTRICMKQDPLRMSWPAVLVHKFRNACCIGVYRYAPMCLMLKVTWTVLVLYLACSFKFILREFEAKQRRRDHHLLNTKNLVGT
jgi:hypothetical protein